MSHQREFDKCLAQENTFSGLNTPCFATIHTIMISSGSEYIKLTPDITELQQ